MARSVKALIDGKQNDAAWVGALHVAGLAQDVSELRELLTIYLKAKQVIK